VVVTEEADSSILGILNDAVPEAERNFANDMITIQLSVVTVNRENVDASFDKGTFFSPRLLRELFLSMVYECNATLHDMRLVVLYTVKKVLLSEFSCVCVISRILTKDTQNALKILHISFDNSITLLAFRNR